MSAIVSALATAATLGVGAGINAYATLLVFGIVARLQPQLFSGQVAGALASTPILILLGVLYAVEFVADKIPAVDHVWDVIHTFIRPLAAALVAIAATRQELSPGLVAVAAAISGGAALTSHVVKAGARGVSTATTGGAASPFLSLAEDAFAFVMAAGAIFVPLLALAVIALLAVPFAYLILAFRRRRRAA